MVLYTSLSDVVDHLGINPRENKVLNVPDSKTIRNIKLSEW